MQCLKISAKRLNLPVLSSFYLTSRYFHFAALVFMVLMALLVPVHVFMRYIARAPLFFAQELAVILFFIVVFAAVPELFIRGQHIRVNIVSDRLPLKVRRRVEMVIATIGLLFMVYFTWYTMRLAIIIYISNEHYQTLKDLPKWPTYMITGVSAVLVSIFMLVYLLKLFKPADGNKTGGTGV